MSELKEKFKTITKKIKIQKKHRKWIILALVFLIVAGTVGGCMMKSKKPKRMGMMTSSEFTVIRQNVSETISNTATVQPKDQYSITALVSGDVISADFEVGDVVEKGTVLYRIDSSEAEKSIESSTLSLEKAQRSHSNTLEDRDNLTVRSEMNGIISEMYIKTGTEVQKGTKIADVYDSSYLELVLPFNAAEADMISVGAAADVTVYGSSQVIGGTVTRVASASYAKTGNMLVRDVSIRVQNPGVLTSGDSAAATVGGIACNDSGTFSYISEGSIEAKVSGKVSELILKKGDRVYVGSAVAKLTSDTIDETIRSSEIQLREAQLSKERNEEQLEDYTITAPISGKVVAKNTKAGDKLDSMRSSGDSTMAVIFDMSSLQFNMSVDELDIGKVKVGQSVKITADAVSGKVYGGTVETVNINGTTSNGVTAYPVTVRITDFDEALIPGMNINAEIVVSNAENVLVVPKTAVARNNIVFVKGEKEDEKDRAPEGFKSVMVETGINNDNFIEIKSGLKEGDVVYITNAGNTMGFGFPGGMGGGIPGGMGGGMPGGMGGGFSGGMGGNRSGGMGGR